ncbi:hypothetical protein Hanom_Chr11g01064631 [Helianthus anomalus]
MFIIQKNLKLTKELLFSLTKPCIQSLCNNGFKSISILKVSFVDFTKSSPTDEIVIVKVLCRPFYVFK